MNEIQKALEQNNTTEGKLSAVLGVVDRLTARVAELEALAESVANMSSWSTVEADFLRNKARRLLAGRAAPARAEE